jgi:CheY-like chemotaxis protein
MKEKEWNILLVEDNDDDAFIVERALRRAGVQFQIARCKDGCAAMKYLEGLSPYDDRSQFPLPHLVLLDLKIPLRNGLEVLRWVRSHDGLKSQIVIVLSSSAESRDVKEAYRCNVNAYLVKPSSPTGMAELARCLQRCWIDQFGALFEEGPALRN